MKDQFDFNIPSIEEQNEFVEKMNKMASVHIYCTKGQKVKFINLAKKEQKKLSEWILEALEEKVNRADL